MYRVLLLLVFLGILILIIWRTRTGKINKKSFKSYVDKMIRSFKENIHWKNGDTLNTIRILSYQLTLLFALLMAVTGFLPILILGGHLTGFPLILHVTLAPFFCVALAVSALFWAHSQQFQDEDWSYLKKCQLNMDRNDATNLKSWQKVYFWLFMLIALPAILSIILSMYPFFGTGGQEALLEIHRYSTLLLFLIISIHIIQVSGIPVKPNK